MNRTFKGHMYSLLHSAQRLLETSTDGSRLLENMMYGRVPGFVCCRCGMSLEEIARAGAYHLISRASARGGPPGVIMCLPRLQTVAALKCSHTTEVLYDVLPSVAGTMYEALMRNALAERINAIAAYDLGQIPIL